MEERIKSAIRELFEKAPETQEVKELQEEMVSNAEEKYRDLIQRGFTEEQSYTMVMASIGDVQELLADLGAQTFQAEQETEESDAQEGGRSEYWEKQSEYWKWQGEYWEKQARNLGHQAKDAIHSIKESGIWENLASGVKQIIGDVGLNMQSDNGEYTDMELRGERRFSQDGIASLIVELQSSPVDLEVRLTTEPEILVQEYYNKEPQKGQLLEYTLNGNQLKIQYGRNVIGIPRSGVVKLFLPEHLAGVLEEFKVVTASGDVTLEDLGASKQSIKTMSGDIKGRCAIGNITLNTASGNVSYEVVEGTCHVKTASGDITIGKMVGKINQNSASGDVEILALEGDGAFHTASGDVEVNVTKAGENLEFGTASGDVEIRLPEDVSVQMTINTASGDIDTFCEHCVTQQHMEYERHGKHAVGIIGEEPYLQLKVNTASGDISVKR